MLLRAVTVLFERNTTRNEFSSPLDSAIADFKIDRPQRARKKTVPSDNVDPEERRKEGLKRARAAYMERVRSDPVKNAARKASNAESQRKTRQNASDEQKAVAREKSRLRQARYRERKKAQQFSEGQTSIPLKRPPATRADAKKKADVRERNKLAQRKRRASMNPQKKRREREKNLQYIRHKRACARQDRTCVSESICRPISNHTHDDVPLPPNPLPVSNPTATPLTNVSPNPSAPTGVSRSTINRVKKRLGAGKKFVLSLKSLVRSAFKKQSKEMSEQGITYSSPSKTAAVSSTSESVGMEAFLKKKRNKSSLVVKRLFTGKDASSLYRRRRMKDGGAAVSFYLERSAFIPGARGNTTKGPRKVLNSSIKSLHKQFVEDRGPLISRSTFFRKKPKSILSFTKTPFRQCLCELCLNPMLCMRALTKLVKVDIESLKDLVNFTICGDNMACLKRECTNCGVEAFDCLVDEANKDKIVEWSEVGESCKT